MPRRGPVEWVDGTGWIVLLGGGAYERGETDVVDASVLAIANLDRPMVVLLSEESQGEAEGIVDHYSNLGGGGGEAFVLSEMNRDDLADPDLLSLLAEAGLLYLGGEAPRTLAQSLHNTAALRQIVQGFATLQGLIVMGAGGGAAALGPWVVDPTTGRESPGLNFLRNAIVAPHFTSTEEAEATQNLLRAHPGFIGLGIPDGTALALGPRGEFKTWGGGEVTAIVVQ